MAASYLHTKRNANADSLCLTAMVDDGLKYLRNMRRKPVTLQIAIGAGTGCVTGYAFSKTSKLAAVFAGCSIILLQFFNYRGYLKFNRTQFQQDLDDITDTVRAELGFEKPVFPNAREIDDFLSKNGYLFSGFIAGSLIGYGLG